MSIYATMGRIGVWVEDELYELWIQGVPPHIDDIGEIWDFLPEPVDEFGDIMRAVFFILKDTKKGTDRNGQEYINPPLMLSGQEFLDIKFVDLIEILTRKIKCLKKKS